MPAVSNTSPLRYLIAVGHADLLPGLFDGILIPPGVADELSDAAAPWIVRRWISSPPFWLRIHQLSAPPDPELVAALDRGEREAIQLAGEQQANVLIMDEWKGRAMAASRGLPLTGALGVLGSSYQKGLIDTPLQILADMRQQGFRISDKLAAKFEALLRTRYAR
jgi:predicted nucleic acid-binding protein